jgi:hypothetical protein
MGGQEGWERLEHPCKKKHQKRGSPTAEESDKWDRFGCVVQQQQQQ